jgi:hypothetical protein
LSLRRCSIIRPPTVVPSVAAPCTSAPSLLDVSASTNTPASCLRAVSINGVIDPKPRNGLAVIASTASGEDWSR